MIVDMWHTGMSVRRVLQKAGLSCTTYYCEIRNGYGQLYMIGVLECAIHAKHTGHCTVKPARGEVPTQQILRSARRTIWRSSAGGQILKTLL